MYDRMFRGQRTLTHRQRAWVERMYFSLKDKPELKKSRAAVKVKVSPAEQELLDSLKNRRRVRGG